MRLEQEHELRRAEVAKKRPTWMVAVTVFASLAAGVLIYVAVASRSAAADANDKTAIAQAEAAASKAAAADAVKRAEAMEHEVAELDGKITSAVARLKDLKEQADIEAANDQLRKLNQQRADAAKRAREFREAEERRKRLEGLKTICATGAICKETK